LINPNSRTLTVADFAPPTALEATFRVRIAPNGGSLRIYAPANKDTPAIVTGTVSQITVALRGPTLIVEPVGAVHWDIVPLGYKDDPTR
jgi:hypothetical protein